MKRAAHRGRRAGRAILGAAAVLRCGGAIAAEDVSSLYGSCLARAYDRPYLAAHPAQRVAAISVQFHGFNGALLASVAWRLRYGTKFGLSSDCNLIVEGGFICTGCTNGECRSGGETFTIGWEGGDSLNIRNEATGMLAGNGAGGRDYLISFGEHSAFALERGSAGDCAW
jgi:hypothetical protein